ncbi:hypothetical protein BCR34DRAFT_257433 [Clohesyomyces aquaticus]|uniref:Uncharacterized protein n=1 Tax=Clohesyomyces aquaticus TaxID=1231657 RepID=A0A1Y1ZU60_9PLEO|nr:hypothetical protein BCR34DRAFT_257433 [Clohesyomyces aquaticus]
MDLVRCVETSSLLSQKILQSKKLKRKLFLIPPAGWKGRSTVEEDTKEDKENDGEQTPDVTSDMSQKKSIGEPSADKSRMRAELWFNKYWRTEIHLTLEPLDLAGRNAPWGCDERPTLNPLIFRLPNYAQALALEDHIMANSFVSQPPVREISCFPKDPTTSKIAHTMRTRQIKDNNGVKMKDFVNEIRIQVAEKIAKVCFDNGYCANLWGRDLHYTPWPLFWTTERRRIRLVEDFKPPAYFTGWGWYRGWK